MNEKAKIYTDKLQALWIGRTRLQKGLLVGSALLILLIIAVVIALFSRTNYAPLYSNLTLAETGQIQEVLQTRGVSVQVSNDGTTIHVPEADVDRLKVELAAEGLPQSGSIDYTFFQEQMGFGMTDNEFTVIERSLMQTELAELIRSISGVQNANVIITIPEDSVWLSSGQESATAAVVLDLATTTALEQSQVKALYHLISRSVPNLPIENIVLSDSNFNNYTYQEEEVSPVASFQSQREVKHEIESDLQQTIMQLLGAVVGPQNAIVSVTTDIDFTQEQRVEDLVEAVDEEEMTGIAISAERINELYEGTTSTGEGVTGTGEEIPNYTGVVPGGDSESERSEERINYEVNRIHREIIESPYQVRDVSIQAMINPPEGMLQLPAQQAADLTEMLQTIVRTTLPSADEAELQNINDRVVVSSMPFAQTTAVDAEPDTAGIPTWMFIVAGALMIVVVVLVILLMRGRNHGAELALDETAEEDTYIEKEPVPFPDRPETDGKKRVRELNYLANEKPEEFSKLLRTWLSDD